MLIPRRCAATQNVMHPTAGRLLAAAHLDFHHTHHRDPPPPRNSNGKRPHHLHGSAEPCHFTYWLTALLQVCFSFLSVFHYNLFGKPRDECVARRSVCLTPCNLIVGSQPSWSTQTSSYALVSSHAAFIAQLTLSSRISPTIHYFSLSRKVLISLRPAKTTLPILALCIPSPSLASALLYLSSYSHASSHNRHGIKIASSQVFKMSLFFFSRRRVSDF